MSTPLASGDRPLALRLRADLVATPVEMSGSTTWVIKDPVTLAHFQFTAEEYSLMQLLRRPVSLAALRREFARQFPPQTISAAAAWDFVRRLHEAGLVVSDARGQGRELLARRRQEWARRWSLAWMQILAIRFRGIDPDALLTAIHARVRSLFSPLALCVVAAVIAYAGSLVIGQWDEFHSRLPALADLADPRNLAWLMLTIGLVKVLHELGHGLACKHYGGEVRELGFMLLVFSPCLYCDVSDAWRFPSKWRRIAVSSAGMAVEMVLAALATIVWWHAQDGIIKLIALNVMFIATVGTLLVNGNPLLRYDGYYILSDLVEIPNLWQRSRDVLRRLAGGWLRTERDEADAAADDPLVPARQRAWLAAYAVASKIYVAFVCVAIVWGLVVMLYPHQLQNVAYAIGMVVMGSALVGPAIGLSRFVRHPARRGELRTGRLALAAAVGLVVSVVVLAWPVNYYVRAPLVLLPADAARVNATIEGLVTAALPAGQSVAAGETIVSLENADVRLGLVRLEGEQRLARLRVEHLERLRGLDPQAGDRLPTARAVLADVERQLEDRRLDARRLTLVAPAEGVVIPVPRRAAQNAPGKAAQLPTWSGAILDASNRGAQIEAGTLVCLVGDPERLTAVLLAGDADAPRLRAGQKARLRLAQLPGQVLEGEVLDVARHEVREEDNTAAAGADLTPLFAGLVPAGESSARYHVQVRFERPAQPLSIGGRGQAKVAAERISLARLILRYFAQTFRLPV